MSQLFAWDGQGIGVSASASVLPVNTQDWSPLGWTGWIFFAVLQREKSLNKQLRLMSPVIRHIDIMNPLYCVLKRYITLWNSWQKGITHQTMRKYQINPSWEILYNCLVLIKCQGLGRQEKLSQIVGDKEHLSPDWILEKMNLSGKWEIWIKCVWFS